MRSCEVTISTVGTAAQTHRAARPRRRISGLNAASCAASSLVCNLFLKDLCLRQEWTLASRELFTVFSSRGQQHDQLRLRQCQGPSLPRPLQLSRFGRAAAPRPHHSWTPCEVVFVFCVRFRAPTHFSKEHCEIQVRLVTMHIRHVCTERLSSDVSWEICPLRKRNALNDAATDPIANLIGAF